MASGWVEDPIITMQKAKLDMFSYTECIFIYQNNTQKLPRGIDDSQHLCAGFKSKAHPEICLSSGSPLQVYSNENCMYSIIGVTSFGSECLIYYYPDVYIRVSHFIDWIEANAFATG